MWHLLPLPLPLLLYGRVPLLFTAAAAAAALLLPSLFSASDRSRLAKASAGARAERRVASFLAAARPAALVHGFRLPGRGDVDHVVLGPCLAVVETKHGRGRVAAGPDGALFVSGRRMYGDPLAQASRAAAQVSGLLSRPATALVVVSDMTNRPFRCGAVTVCAPGDVARVLAALPHLFSQDEAVAAAKRLQGLSKEE